MAILAILDNEFSLSLFSRISFINASSKSVFHIFTLILIPINSEHKQNEGAKSKNIKISRKIAFSNTRQFVRIQRIYVKQVTHK
jgi:hypothetical protein